VVLSLEDIRAIINQLPTEVDLDAGIEFCRIIERYRRGIMSKADIAAHMYRRLLEEGDACDDKACDGTYTLPEADNCSCHIDAPCESHRSRELQCSLCTYQPGEIAAIHSHYIERREHLSDKEINDFFLRKINGKRFYSWLGFLKKYTVFLIDILALVFVIFLVTVISSPDS